MKNDRYYMNIAYKEALKAYNCGEVPIGAVIVQNDKIIAKAHNMREKNRSVLEHAELITLKKACKKLNNWRLNDCIMYITAFPCPMCASAINQARVSKIVYGTVPNNINSQLTVDILKSSDYGKPVDIMQIEEYSDCTAIMRDFFSKKR